jgi:hypothetical protein
LSHRFHDYARLGESLPNLVVVRGIDTIDASGIDTDFLGHSYFSEARAVIEDVAAILCRGLPTSDRNLLREQFQDLPYWKVKVPPGALSIAAKAGLGKGRMHLR